MKRKQMSAGLKMMLERAHEDPVSAFNAALLLEEEHRGAASVQYFCQRAAEGGYVPAMIKLAGIYITGRYVHDEYEEEDKLQDIETGVSWLQRGADIGDHTACYMLAHCYFEGFCLECNPVKASYYLSQAAFPIYPANPYEPTEILIFGYSSHRILEYLQRQQRSKRLSRAG